MSTGSVTSISIGLFFAATTALAGSPLRSVHDAGRDQTWVLERDALYLHDASSHAVKARFELPQWTYVAEPYGCAPDLAIDAQGAAVVTSNVVPVLWRVDPLKSAITRHELTLDADADKDVGFSALVYSSDQGMFYAASSTYGTVWRIDPLLRRAQKLPLSIPVRGTCGLALDRTKTRRTVVLCAVGTEGDRLIHLTPDQRSGYVFARPCTQGSGLWTKPSQVPGRFLLSAALLLAMPARAQSRPEFRLLSAASMQTVFGEVISDFERRSGYRVSLRYSTMGAITERVSAGEQADLVISSPASISTLVERGRIDPASRVTIARTGVGMVVPAGDPAPRLASLDDFKQALLDAKVVVYANPAGGGAAGIHIAKVIEKLGIADALRPKTKYGAGGDVAEVTIAQGPGAVGLTQVSEIVGKSGMQFVAVPDALQNYTGFVAGTPSGGQPSEAARQFIAFLRTPRAVAVMKTKGMQVD